MSDRKDFYTGELVTQNRMDSAFDQLEVADRAMTADAGVVGIYEGLGVAQHAGTPDLTVDVSVGTAYATAGERMRAAILERIDISVDRDGISTTIVGALNSRIISVVVRPDRILSDPQTDASSATVYTQRTESYVIEVIQGAEAVSPTAPAIPSDCILLADINRTFVATQIFTADIVISGYAARRQDAFNLPGTTFGIRTGKVKTALQTFLNRYNLHIEGGADLHDAGDVAYLGSGFWADGFTVVSAGGMDDAITEIVSDLASTGGTDSGEQRIGCEQDNSIGSNVIAASTLKARLQAIRLATNLYYAGSGVWADSSTGIAAGTVEAALDSIVSVIAASTGAAKMGMAAVGNFTAGTVQAAVAQLAATTSSNDGAKRIGTQGSGNFAGTTVRAQIDELIQTTSTNDGAKRIGAQAVAGSYTAGTVRSQLDELISGTQAVTGAKTFSDLTIAGTAKVKYVSRSITRAQGALLYNPITNVWDVGSINIAADAVGTQDLERIPDGATLTAVTTYHNRDNSGVMPGQRVILGLWKQNIVTGVLSAIGIVTTDPNATLGSYEPHHGFAITGLSEVIDRTAYTYYAVLSGETGADKTFTQWFGCTATFDVAHQDEAP